MKLSPGGIYMPANTDYGIDLPSHFIGMAYRAPEIVGGVPMNRPCHIIITEHMPSEVDKHDCIKDYGNGWHTGIMCELGRGSSINFGTALGRRSPMAKGGIEWKIAITVNNYLNLEDGGFMDAIITFVLEHCKIDVSANERTVLGRVMRGISQDRFRIKSFVRRFVHTKLPVASEQNMIRHDRKTDVMTKVVRRKNILGRVVSVDPR